MKSFCCYLFLLLVLIGGYYFLSEKDEAVRKADSDHSEKAVFGDEIQEPSVGQDNLETVTKSDPETIPQQNNDPAEQTPVTPKVPLENPYYAAVIGMSGDELKNGLHQIIRGHRSLTYGELWAALRDLDGGDEGQVVLIYDRTQRSHSRNGGDQGDWNREHLWPRAYGVRRSSSANTDLHHIRASDVGINGKRGHLYFDESDVDDSSGQRYSSDLDSWEPPNVVKGDIARAMFYMAVRYEGEEAGSVDLELSNHPNMKTGVHGKLSTLLSWHRMDPVSDEERARNQKIHRNYQGNRNPFIDHPEWVESIFNEMKSE